MVNKKFLWEVTTWDKRFSGIDKSMQPKVIKYHYYLAKELKEIEQEDGDIRILYTTEEEAYTNRENVGDNISSGEIVAIPWGGNASVKYFNGEFVTADNRIATSSNTDILLNKYLYYWMLSHLDELESYYRGAGIKHPSMYSVLTMEITIPDPKIQQDIITKLDNITSLISNLNKEIKLTKKQFEHYRDTLLDLEGKEGVEMIKLGDYANVLRGKRLTKQMLNEEAYYPVFHGGIEPLGKYEHYNREANTVMIINVGASAGTVGFCDCKFWSSDGCFCISHSELFNDKFLFYYMQTKTHFLQSQVRYAGIPTLDNSVVENIMVPKLPPANQANIVSKLDTFSNLISKLEEERDLHQKQYEYYREKLLTFE